MPDMRMLTDNKDDGNPFDWGKTSKDYAVYRDIYPAEFYERIVQLGVGVAGQSVLDLGTGSGVLPRNLHGYGAKFTGMDVSPEQIAEAKRLSAENGTSIEYHVARAEDLDFPANSFDAATACQCFFYFDKAALMPKLSRVLKPGGLLAILFMAWLPGESRIASLSEELVLKYNPSWTGAGWRRQPVVEPTWARDYGFRVVHTIAFDVLVPFARESWNGRIRACRGVGASLAPDELAAFDREHVEMLRQNAPESFAVPHDITILVMENTK